MKWVKKLLGRPKTPIREDANFCGGLQWADDQIKGMIIRDREISETTNKRPLQSLKESLAIKQSIDDYLMTNYTGHWINSEDLKKRLAVAKWELNKEEKEMTVDQFAEKFRMGNTSNET